MRNTRVPTMFTWLGTIIILTGLRQKIIHHAVPHSKIVFLYFCYFRFVSFLFTQGLTKVQDRDEETCLSLVLLRRWDTRRAERSFRSNYCTDHHPLKDRNPTVFGGSREDFFQAGTGLCLSDVNRN